MADEQLYALLLTELKRLQTEISEKQVQISDLRTKLQDTELDVAANTQAKTRIDGIEAWKNKFQEALTIKDLTDLKTQVGNLRDFKIRLIAYGTILIVLGQILLAVLMKVFFP